MPTNTHDPILILAAHPDDETIGAGIFLSRTEPRRILILHLTDGSPRGHANREEYFHERRRELSCAMDMIGIRPDQCLNFKYTDQDTLNHLEEITSRLAAFLHEWRPGIIYTHPYEGGHPDHDSAALVAIEASKREGDIPVHEFTSYHRGQDGRLVTGEFLGEGGEIEVVDPTDAERELKRKMYDCFQSQKNVLKDFAIKPEKFRPAPAYDFSQPPHPGSLHYESLGWGISGVDWRAEASKVLGLQRS